MRGERFTGIDKMSSRGGLDGNLDRFELPGWIPRRNETVSRISNVIPGIEQSLSRPLPSKRARYYDLQRRRKLELLGYFSAVRPSPQFLDSLTHTPLGCLHEYAQEGSRRERSQTPEGLEYRAPSKFRKGADIEALRLKPSHRFKL